MLEDLGLQGGLDGRVGRRHTAGLSARRSHRHAELEVNLVVEGTASYLLDDRRYDLSAGTLTWLFPDQEHVLVDESADHDLWWAVFRPSVVDRIAVASPHGGLLAERDPASRYSRRIDLRRVQRLAGLLRDLHEAETHDAVLFNTGLTYLLALSWRAFLDSSDVVGGRQIHPAVEAVARVIQADPDSGDLTTLARRVGLSPSHLSRLFATQMGLPLSRFRNQQRLDRFLALYGDGRTTTALSAALQAGFGSYAQFYRVFRRETGHNPRALR